MNRDKRAYQVLCTLGVILLLVVMCRGLDLIRRSFTPVVDPVFTFWLGATMMIVAGGVLIGLLILILAKPFRTWLNQPVMARLELLRVDVLSDPNGSKAEIINTLHNISYELEGRRPEPTGFRRLFRRH